MAREHDRSVRSKSIPKSFDGIQTRQSRNIRSRCVPTRYSPAWTVKMGVICEGCACSPADRCSTRRAFKRETMETARVMVGCPAHAGQFSIGVRSWQRQRPRVFALHLQNAVQPKANHSRTFDRPLTRSRGFTHPANASWHCPNNSFLNCAASSARRMC